MEINEVHDQVTQGFENTKGLRFLDNLKKKLC